MSDPASPDHRQAAEAFGSQIEARFDEVVEEVLLYGSVARGDHRGVDSDVDILVVLRDSVDRETYEARIRELAYDIELEHAVVLSLLVTTASEFAQHGDRSFTQQIRRDGIPLDG